MSTSAGLRFGRSIRSSPELFVAVPVKPFGVAKDRLGPVLDRRARRVLGKHVAAHTIDVAKAAGFPVAIVTADPGVATWASHQGADVITEPTPQGLDRAAGAAVEHITSLGLAWAIVHADLPLVTPEDLRAVQQWLPSGGVLLAPSHDGGTNVVAGDVDGFGFSYGPGSFRRHLAAAGPSVRVLVRLGLALDLDTPEDLEEVELLWSTREAPLRLPSE